MSISMYKQFCKAQIENFYDVIIVGNGLVGKSLLSALVKCPLSQKMSCLVVGTADTPIIIKDYKAHLTKNRAFTLSLNSKKFLDNIGAWNKISEKSCQPVHSIIVMWLLKYIGLGFVWW
uniref:Ubiquinone biosynthesis monooxygenase COQ6, mitochondrial (Trinotate prediction) n=1 Tax=Henneguya salminicola TaxID=69463 RepID=A0A6G3MLH6_HENSL